MSGPPVRRQVFSLPAGRAVFYAATHRRRELWVGWPAVPAILGTRFLAGLLDRMLGRTALRQRTGRP